MALQLEIKRCRSHLDHARYLHILPGVRHSHVFIHFIAENFRIEDHCFLLLEYGKYSSDINIFIDQKLLDVPLRIQVSIFHADNTEKIDDLLTLLPQFDGIFLHGLYNPNLLHFLQRYILELDFSRIYYIPWGEGDIQNITPSPNDGFTVNSVPKKLAFPAYLQHVISGLQLYTFLCDRLRLFKDYIEPEYHFALYPSNIVEIPGLIQQNLPPHSSNISILVGHHAVPEAGHAEVLNYLSNYKENIQVFSPLSYGSESYKVYISKLGLELLGSQFVPMDSLIPQEQYIRFLSRMNIAIFNHKQHQASSTITWCLALGVKVYLREDQGGWDVFRKHFRFKIYSTNELLMQKNNFSPTLFDYPQSERCYNEQLAQSTFSKKSVRHQWLEIFQSCIRHNAVFF